MKIERCSTLSEAPRACSPIGPGLGREADGEELPVVFDPFE